MFSPYRTGLYTFSLIYLHSLYSMEHILWAETEFYLSIDQATYLSKTTSRHWSIPFSLVISLHFFPNVGVPSIKWTLVCTENPCSPTVTLTDTLQPNEIEKRPVISVLGGRRLIQYNWCCPDTSFVHFTSSIYTVCTPWNTSSGRRQNCTWVPTRLRIFIRWLAGIVLFLSLW